VRPVLDADPGPLRGGTPRRDRGLRACRMRGSASARATDLRSRRPVPAAGIGERRIGAPVAVRLILRLPSSTGATGGDPEHEARTLASRGRVASRANCPRRGATRPVDPIEAVNVGSPKRVSASLLRGTCRRSALAAQGIRDFPWSTGAPARGWRHRRAGDGGSAPSRRPVDRPRLRFSLSSRPWSASGRPSRLV
jgi:hypothetical protein